MQPINEELIQEIKNRIVSAVHPEKIILFGSYAYGIPTRDRSNCRCKKLNNTLIPLEPLLYSPLEFETMKKEKRDFIMTIEEEGIEIYTNSS